MIFENEKEIILPRDTGKLANTVEKIEEIFNRAQDNMIDRGIVFCRYNDGRKFHIIDQKEQEKVKGVEISIVISGSYNKEKNIIRDLLYRIRVDSDFSLHFAFGEMKNGKVRYEKRDVFSFRSKKHSGYALKSDFKNHYLNLISQIWNSIIDINLTLTINNGKIEDLPRHVFEKTSFNLGFVDLVDRPEMEEPDLFDPDVFEKLSEQERAHLLLHKILEALEQRYAAQDESEDDGTTDDEENNDEEEE